MHLRLQTQNSKTIKINRVINIEIILFLLIVFLIKNKTEKKKRKETDFSYQRIVMCIEKRIIQSTDLVRCSLKIYNKISIIKYG